MEKELEFTGERYHPTIKGNIFLEHMHRYVLSQGLVAGKTVLDIACGEGFGSNLLLETAASVIGVDISADAIAHAQSKYGSERLSFIEGSITAIPLPDACVDVVVSFETIEHIAEHEAMMREVKRVLRPGGMLVVSTPDKATYTDATGNSNPYHVKELYRDEFETLIASYFKHHTMHGQKISFGSVVAPFSQTAAFKETSSTELTTASGVHEALYLIAVASDDPENLHSMSGLFMQDIQSSEPVLKRVEFEKEAWSEIVSDEFAWISTEIDAVQRLNVANRASTFTVIKRLILSRILYRLAKVSRFGKRRRSKFLISAQKRDPLMLNSRIDQFKLEYLTRSTKNPILAEQSLRRAARSNIWVTAIVPNYNHAGFLKQRLDSILSQTYPLIDVIVMDDCSTDESRSVIDDYVARFPDRIRAVYNETNSGSVFSQWQKGHSMAKGDLIWICESDDFCEANFVERMIPSFYDPSVLLGFGRIELVDSEGVFMPGLESYRESAEPGIWDEALVRTAASWFKGGFGVKNLIANVGGSLWRNVPISEDVWQEARDFKIMGDWFVYASLAQGGQIAYEPTAVAYFRNHAGNTSGINAQAKPSYYEEYTQLMTALKRRWPIPDETIDRFVANCQSVHTAAKAKGTRFEELVPADQLKNVPTENMHVMIGMLGFSFGGGELFPIHLANALRQQGVMVSILQMTDAHDQPDVRAMLDTSIPVYTAQTVRDSGGAAFLADAGISVIHSHIVSIEMMVLKELQATIPFVATLHGSYEAMKISSRDIKSWASKVDQFVYTADRNLTPFANIDLPQDEFVKFRNAMPVDDRPFEKTRKQMGIPEDAIVFAFVARGVEGKGWLETVRAFTLLRERCPDQPMALLAVGKGTQTDAARALAQDVPDIHFLGFVKTIHGIYRMSDIALVPTRFSGESYPLCLIQAMQSGTPSIATDVGEIKAMLHQDDLVAGLIIPNIDDNDAYVDALTNAMEQCLDPSLRAELRADAHSVGENYSIDALASQYLELYGNVAARAGTKTDNVRPKRRIS